MMILENEAKNGAIKMSKGETMDLGGKPLEKETHFQAETRAREQNHKRSLKTFTRFFVGFQSIKDGSI
ncbi:hypothetical protein ACMD2_20370 [Ananas comosus]|uniref:Uncharacterized protein n=1 Tax=Ananas comosus TaxID=4615 RepID=A0A199UDD0_ANACO|nr:hypothetical protein ACMD2_20370 [Ananas comosus]